MKLVHRVASMWRWLFSRDRTERQMHDELQTFVDMAAADRVRDGMAPAEARRQAILQLGGVEQTKERVRTRRHGAWVDAVARDVRYALRMYARNPGISAVIIITLAVGIGANTAVFSIADAVLLRPLSYRQPERLVVVHDTVPHVGRVPVGAFEFEGWRRSAQSFDQMALMAVAPVILTGAGEPERLDAARVSPALFPMLGIDAAIGRTFTKDEETVGRHQVVLLSDGLWRQHFGADPSIVGRSITLNDQPYVVTGILPARFRFPKLEQLFVMGITGGTPQLWVPFAITDRDRGENSFAAMARLTSGVTPEQASAEATAITDRLVQEIPNATRMGAEVVSLQTQIVGASRSLIVLTWAAIILVLLIACGNIANLLLTRTITRGPELALRSALGASRAVVVRQMLIETLTLVVIGGVGGALLALWLLPVILRYAPPGVPRLDEVVINLRALLFAGTVTVATGTAIGLLPARRASRANLVDSLQHFGRTSSPSRGDRATRNVMVVCQTALTTVCLAAAGLVVTSFVNVLHVDPGFRADQVLTVDVSLSPRRFRTLERAVFVRSVLERLHAIPGVTSVGFVNKPPLSGISLNSLIVLEGTEQAPIPFAQRPQGDVRSVDPGYFRTFGIPVLRGTTFDESQTRPVAVVSAAVADRVWPGESALGKRFRLTAQPNTLIEVVGVTGNVRNMGLEGDVSPTVYLPFWQYPISGATFAVRSGPNSTPTAAVRAVLSDANHDVPIDHVRTMQSVVSDSVAARSFQATLLAVFGVIAVALAGIGLFGVMAYAVAQRTKELGIRLALGATAASLQRMIVGHTLRLVAAGLAVGLPLAVASGFALRHMLFGVQPQDARVLVASSVVLVVLAILAGWIPALRVARIDPVATLRMD